MTGDVKPGRLELVDTRDLVKELAKRADSFIIGFTDRDNRRNPDGNFAVHINGPLTGCLGLAAIIRRRLLEATDTDED